MRRMPLCSRGSSKAREKSGLRGMTLVEVSVAAGILMLLLAAIVGIYQSSARVWRKVDIRTSLLRELQVAVRYLERGLEVSHSFGLDRAPTLNALAYLSALDGNDEIHVNDQGKPEWQRFVIVYVDAKGLLRRREESLTPSRAVPPTFKEATGYQLAPYLTYNPPKPADRFLTHSGIIETLELKNGGNYGSLYELIIQAKQKKTELGARVGDPDKFETLEIRTKISLRN